ncbi:MAG: hypothetical protein OEW39_05675 [Deltaproteobacteria bacterium]|nr:hypothetical protein [Deltaproteobacteria bacterium]
MNLLTKLVGSARQNTMDLLNHLDREKTNIRIEVENTNLQFQTRLMVRSEAVLVAKPPALKEGLTKGSFVRFQVPGVKRSEVRMEVVAPHFNLTTGSIVFICKIPTSILKTNRKETRYNTTRFNNIHLHLEGRKGSLRVIDLSTIGVRVHTASPDTRALLPLNTALANAYITLGDRGRIDLLGLTPRVNTGTSVGCEMKIKPECEALLTNLLESLEKAESEYLME